MTGLWLACILAAVDEDSFTVTLAFEKMHCDECRAELEASVKKIQGFKSVTVAGSAATLAFEDKAPIPSFNRLPKDLRLLTATLALRGAVSFSGEKATLVAKGSGATLSLQNPGKGDRLAELKQSIEKQKGKNRFQITGVLAAGGRSLVLESFQPADWK